MALSYTSPGITVSTLGATVPLSAGPAPTTVGILATFPKGPDYPVLITPDQGALIFGDPTVSSSVGYTGPWGMQLMSLQTQGLTTPASPIQFLVMRVGVTRGTLALAAASSGTALNVYGIGKYAGSAAANLKVSVAGSGSSYALNLIDGPTGKTLQTFAATQYDLTTNQAIANALNGANPLNSASSIAYVTVGSGTGLPIVLSATALSAGTDGKGAAYNDATVAPLLQASLWAHCDYLWAGYDAALVSTALLSHLSTATAQSELRRAILGPASGTTYASLSTSYNSLQSARARVVAHDGVRLRNPVTGILGQADGFMLAACYAGMKASAGTAETCAGFTPVGISGVAIPPDLTDLPTPAQLQVLGGAGLLYFKQPSGRVFPQVGDDITTAPYLVNNQINPFYHGNVQDIDDAVLSTALAATQPFSGRGMPDFASLQNGVGSAVTTAVGALTGRVHNGLNPSGVQTSLDPTTSAPNTTISYKTKWPIGTFNIQSGFTFA